MPKFEVKLAFEYSPGQVNGMTEGPPRDLLDEKGKLMQPLAIWPQQPAQVEADTPEQAVSLVKEQWKSQNQPIFLDERISRERFAELENRPRPGQEHLNCVVACWMARPYAKMAQWQTSYENFAV
jgi:hypothetical protein